MFIYYLFDSPCELWYNHSNVLAKSQELTQSGEDVLQRMLALVIVGIVLLWIVLSYIPATLLPLPTFAFASNSNWLAILAVVVLALFLALQVWVVVTTGRTTRHYQTTHARTPEFRLKLGR